MKEKTGALLKLIASVVIFGTIGVFRKNIPLPSATIAMARGMLGTAFLLLVMGIGRKRFSRRAVRENLLLLCLSGAAMGFNWILLFEAYNYTSVATATLCYYMAPIFTILASPLILKERLTARSLLCVLAALLGMVLVSGVLDAEAAGAGEAKGVLLGLGAAVLYTCVMLLNKRMKPMPDFDRTVIQLFSAAVVLLVYTLATGELRGLTLTPSSGAMLLIVCVVHTGIAYMLYFGSMEGLPAKAIALFSYVDPVVAVLLSALLLREPLSVQTGLGAVLVLGGAMVSELPARSPDKAPRANRQEG